jgi:hypothetical protein
MKSWATDRASRKGVRDIVASKSFKRKRAKVTSWDGVYDPG